MVMKGLSLSAVLVRLASETAPVIGSLSLLCNQSSRDFLIMDVFVETKFL